MSAVFLGLASAIFWGVGDFVGGMQSRRLPAFAVVLWSQLAGALMLLGAVLLMRLQPSVHSILWGMAGGAVGAVALVLFYRGLASGIMSLVAPVSACGVLVPVTFSIAIGHVPRTEGLVGVAAAISGVVLVSVHSSSLEQHARLSRGTLYCALGAALGFGLFFVCVGQGSGGHGASPLWTVAGARMGSLLFLLVLIALRRASAPWPGPRLPLIALAGLLDSGANLLYATATTRGTLAIVAVLGSLYPVTTVLLGQLVLSERLSRLQGAGVGLALVGVALISAA